MTCINHGQAGTRSLEAMVDDDSGQDEPEPYEGCRNNSVAQGHLACSEVANRAGQDIGHEELGGEGHEQQESGRAASGFEFFLGFAKR